MVLIFSVKLYLSFKKSYRLYVSDLNKFKGKNKIKCWLKNKKEWTTWTKQRGFFDVLINNIFILSILKFRKVIYYLN